MAKSDNLINLVFGDVLRDRIFAGIDAERIRQDEKWGAASARNLPLTTYLTVLAEEVGEVAESILKGPTRIDGAEQTRGELIQVAAVAVAMIEAIDAGKAPFGLEKEDAG